MRGAPLLSSQGQGQFCPRRPPCQCSLQLQEGWQTGRFCCCHGNRRWHRRLLRALCDCCRSRRAGARYVSGVRVEYAASSQRTCVRFVRSDSLFPPRLYQLASWGCRECIHGFVLLLCARKESNNRLYSPVVTRPLVQCPGGVRGINPTAKPSNAANQSPAQKDDVSEL